MIRLLVWMFVVINLGIGVACLVDPMAVMATVGVTSLNEGGVVELRAMYGGMQFGIGVFLAWCAIRPERVRIGLTAATLQIGGLGFARLGACLVSWPEGWLFPFLCVIEIGAALLGAIALSWPVKTAK